VAIEEGAPSKLRGHGVNRVLDDALEAFIEVLDRHTIADMLKRRPPLAEPARRKGGRARTMAPAGARARRPLHDNR
jgi:hypothetical protein